MDWAVTGSSSTWSPSFQGGWLDLGLPGPVRMLMSALKEPRRAVDPVAVAAG